MERKPNSPVPEPPDSFSPAEKRAWMAGGAAMLRFMGSQSIALAGRLGSGDTPPQPAGEDGDDGPGDCPECGAELTKSFGGPTCLNCGWGEDDQQDES